VGSREYLTRFAKAGEIPVATKGHYRMHDITAYIGSVFLPEAYMRVSRKQILALLDFEKFLKARHPKLYAQLNFEEILRKQARRIDFSQGNIFHDYGLWKQDAQSTSKTRMALEIHKFTYGGRFSDVFIRDTILSDAETRGGISSALDSVMLRYLERHRSKLREDFPTASELASERLDERVEFIRSQVRKHWQLGK
jgi:hypothetical protein